MPVDMSRYPDNWREISDFIRFERADGKCECTGECGSHNGERCNALHATPIWRHNTEPWRYIVAEEFNADEYEFNGFVIVVLTTAHLGADKPDGTPGDKHDKLDCRPENLKAMCQRCHLAFDLDEHIANAARTRYQKKIEAGQMELI